MFHTIAAVRCEAVADCCWPWLSRSGPLRAHRPSPTAAVAVAAAGMAAAVFGGGHMGGGIGRHGHGWIRRRLWVAWGGRGGFGGFGNRRRFYGGYGGLGYGGFWPWLRLRSGLRRLRRLRSGLWSGLRRLRSGLRRLWSGLRRLWPGLRRLWLRLWRLRLWATVTATWLWQVTAIPAMGERVPLFGMAYTARRAASATTSAYVAPGEQRRRAARGAILGIDEEPVVACRRQKGMKITKVYPGTAAEKAGLQAGDVLRSVNGYLTEQRGNLAWIIANATPNNELKIERADREGRPRSCDHGHASRDVGSSVVRVGAE